MTRIALYIEGGGDSHAGKAALRQGFDGLLAVQKNAARLRNMQWKTVLCGSRGATFKAFMCATENNAADLIALVVDAEGPVENATPQGRVAHLQKRDRWTFENVDASRVHLMTECMEAWLVADPGALENFYGKGFHQKSLPKRAVLDQEPKDKLYEALDAATKKTKKGSYGKIKHAAELLKLIGPEKVAIRCASFRDLVEWLNKVTL